MLNCPSDEYIREEPFCPLSEPTLLMWQMMWERFAVAFRLQATAFHCTCTKSRKTFQGRETAVCLWQGCGILITSEMIPETLLLPSRGTELCCSRAAVLVLLSVCVCVYLLHRCIATNQLLPQVGDVVVEPLHVLLEVLPEGQERLLHFTLELLRQKRINNLTLTRGWQWKANLTAQDLPNVKKLCVSWSEMCYLFYLQKKFPAKKLHGIRFNNVQVAVMFK